MYWPKLPVLESYYIVMATCLNCLCGYSSNKQVPYKHLMFEYSTNIGLKQILLYLGVFDRGIEDLAANAVFDKHGRNTSKNLHHFIHKKNRTLAVNISSVDIPVKIRKPNHIRSKPWPVLHLSSWLQTCMENPQYGGYFFLGGKTLDQIGEVRQMFKNFWQNYCHVDGTMPESPETTIPILIHGDEGRGQLRRPLMIISFQCIISWAGENCFQDWQNVASTLCRLMGKNFEKIA